MFAFPKFPVQRLPFAFAFGMVLLMAANLAWAGKDSVMLGYDVHAFCAAPDTLLEMADEPKPGTPDNWTPVKPGDLIMKPCQLRFGGKQILRMTSSEVKWESETAPAVTDWGKSGMVIFLGQKVNLYLERDAGAFTHSADVEVMAAKDPNFFDIQLRLRPVAAAPSNPGNAANANTEAKAVFEETITLAPDIWTCMVEQSEDKGTVLVFVRLSLMKKSCH